MTIIGKKSLVALDSTNYKGKREKEVMEALELTMKIADNTAVQATQDITSFMASRINQVPRINGTPIPVEITNAFFTEGGISTDAPGFDSYYKNFTMKKSIPIQLKAFSHTTEEILSAQNAGIALMEKDAKDLATIQRLYINRYLPNVRLLALLTGHSNTSKISTKATVGSDEDYTRAFGWIHGENVEDFMPVVRGIANANHYRVKVGDDLSITDIDDIVDLLTAYDSYSGQGIVALANARVISNLGKLYTTDEYRDGILIEGKKTPVINGIEFLEVSQLSNDFIIFLDKGKNNLMLQCVNPAENQRGFKLVDERDNSFFKLADGFPKGTKAVIFEEEYLIADRVAGAVLDINADRKDASGEMGAESITALEAYCALVEKMYKRTL